MWRIGGQPMKPFSYIVVAAVTLTATTPNIVLAGETT